MTGAAQPAVPTASVPPTEPPTLQGKTVVVTRASHQAPPLADALRAAGAEVIVAPAIAIVPPLDGGQGLDDALLRLEQFTWVAFTSTNAVAATFARADRRGVRRRFARVRVAAVGPTTARRVEAESGRPVDVVPSVHTAAQLAAHMGEPKPDDHCFVPQATDARPDLTEGLRAQGWKVTTANAYRTVHPSLPANQLPTVQTADAVVFASPSAVTGHLSQLASHGAQTPAAAVVAIGPTTAAACAQLGLEVAAQATSPSHEHLIAATASAIASHGCAKG